MLRLKPIQLLPSTEMFDAFGFSQAEFLNLVNKYKTNPNKTSAIIAKYGSKSKEIMDAILTYLTPIYPNSLTGSKGLLGSQHSEDGPGRCDQCKIRDLDIELMEKEATDAAAKQYDKFYEKVISKTDRMIEKWDYIRDVMFPGDIEAARKYSREHPMQKLASELKLSPWGCIASTYYLEDTHETARNKFIENARCQAFSTFAVVKDGKWYEKGEMGWWGMVHDEKLAYDWNAKFNELLHELPDDTTISIVDCHI